MIQTVSELVAHRLYPRRLRSDQNKVLLELATLTQKELEAGFYIPVLPEVAESDLVYADLDDLVFDAEPVYQPAGYIFHLGRCGSTATVNMLNSLDQYQVISEAVVFHDLAMAQLCKPIDDELNRRRKLIDLFCLLNESEKKRTIIKCASWEVRLWDEYTRLYPGVRSCLIVRNMLEIMVALLKSPPDRLRRNKMRARLNKAQAEGRDDLKQLIDQLFGPELDYLAEQDYVDFIGNALQTALNQILAYSGECLVIDHKEIDQRVPSDLCSYFGILPSEQQIETMRQSAGYDAKSDILNKKSQNETYIDDSERKAVEATPETRRWCENTLQPLLDSIISKNR